MILAAGLGSRLRPLTDLRPKPAVPVCGIPLVAYTLALLARHGVSEVVINLHHHPGPLQETAERWCPPGLGLRFSREKTLLDTGGGVRRVASFLRESDPCLLVGGDMLVDVDLSALVSVHRRRGDAMTLLLKEDRRAGRFGTLGLDDDGVVRRIADRLDLGGATRAGVWPWVNVVAARAFEAMPDREIFVFLDDWVGGMLRAGRRDVRGWLAAEDAILWEPVGRLDEYLRVNLSRRELSYLDAEGRARASGVRLGDGFVVGANAHLGADVVLERAVVWDGESVPARSVLRDGVFAGGTFHSCTRGDADD